MSYAKQVSWEIAETYFERPPLMVDDSVFHEARHFAERIVGDYMFARNFRDGATPEGLPVVDIDQYADVAAMMTLTIFRHSVKQLTLGERISG